MIQEFIPHVIGGLIGAAAVLIVYFLTRSTKETSSFSTVREKTMSNEHSIKSLTDNVVFASVCDERSLRIEEKVNNVDEKVNKVDNKINSLHNDMSEVKGMVEAIYQSNGFGDK